MDLNINKKKAYLDVNGRFNFPYTTPYSQTNTGLFCTPEVNDRVIVYYSTEEEIEGYIMGAVNNKGSGRFSNLMERNFTINKDDENIFNFHINKDSLNIESNNITIKTKDLFELNSQNTISIYSHKILNLTSKENFKILSNEIKIKYKDKIETGDAVKSKGSSINLDFSNVVIKGNLKSI